MNEFTSSIAPLIANVDIPWKDATENLARELERYVQEQLLSTKTFASQDEYKRFVAVSNEAEGEGADELEALESMGPEAFAEMEDDPRTRMLREQHKLLAGVSQAPTLQELDTALTHYEKFLDEQRIDRGELRNHIGSYLFERQREFNEDVEALVARRREEMKEAGQGDGAIDDISEEEFRETTEHLLRTGEVQEVPAQKRVGEKEGRRERKKEMQSNVVEFDLRRRHRG